MKGAYKIMLLKMMDALFNRKQILHLSSALRNMALGENNGNMKLNGELLALRQVLKSVRQKNDHDFVFFDVGANVGDWTNALLHIASEEEVLNKVSVYCFEPSVFTYSQLQTAIKDLYDKGKMVNTVNSGMGNHTAKNKLFISHEGAGTNSLYKRRTEGIGITYDKVETVKITTVDLYCQENNISHIDYMKIDVEGHELAVVSGSKSLLENHAIDYIQFEYGGSWIDSRTLFLDMYDFLKSFGYIIGKLMPKGIEFYDKYDPRLETFQMANFLACQPGEIGLFKRIKPWMV